MTDMSVLASMPDWVPDSARLYLAHTEQGISIRRLAREVGCHASTVLRTVRKIEARRDDPLVDAALRGLGPDRGRRSQWQKDIQPMISTDIAPDCDDASLEIRACPALRHLSEPGAILAVAEGMENAVVMNDSLGHGARKTVLATELAQAMALRDWISCEAPGRISRYVITPSGRTVLRAQDSDLGDEPGPRRAPVAESPLHMLARRRDKSGRLFLTPSQIRAGERLREDFELSQIGPHVAQNWDHFLTAGVSGGQRSEPGGTAAQERLAAALGELGPGLGDVALRCCCYMEGLEKTEQRMGWSSRSGKIVLRIALDRLCRHYEQVIGPGGGLIG